MQLNEALLKAMFGYKIRSLRNALGMSLHDVSEACGLSVSYINEIEHGKKYPKPQKIIALAHALHSSYDELISSQLTGPFSPLQKLFDLHILDIVPVEFLGIDQSVIIDYVLRDPIKANALISTIVEIARNYELQQSDLYYNILRSIQETHENYFEEIEIAAENTRKKCGINREYYISKEALLILLKNQFNIGVEEPSHVFVDDLKYLRYISVPKQNKIILNPLLSDTQKTFAMAKELGYRVLGLKEVNLVSPMVEITSLDEVIHNFKASYFASALLMGKKLVLLDIKKIIRQKNWNSSILLDIMNKYVHSPEVFVQRLTNLLPKYFNLKNLFFLRFDYAMRSNTFKITKEFHLNKLHNPHGNGLGEEYCRRWVSIKALQQLEKNILTHHNDNLVSMAQISKYYNSDNHYFVMTIARKKNRHENMLSSVSLGFQIDEEWINNVGFAQDEHIPVVTVNETCARCPISNCMDRAEAPLIIERQQKQNELKNKIQELLATTFVGL